MLHPEQGRVNSPVSISCHLTFSITSPELLRQPERILSLASIHRKQLQALGSNSTATICTITFQHRDLSVTDCCDEGTSSLTNTSKKSCTVHSSETAKIRLGNAADQGHLLISSNSHGMPISLSLHYHVFASSDFASE